MERWLASLVLGHKLFKFILPLYYTVSYGNLELKTLCGKISMILPTYRAVFKL